MDLAHRPKERALPVNPFDPLIDGIVAILIALITNLPAWISALAAMLTFLVAGVALVYARGQIREARESRELTQTLELERSQPYVVVYTEASALKPLFVDLVVKNYGPTAARDIRIDIAPWPIRSWPDAGTRVDIPSVIRILAPGQEWRTAWDSTEKRLDANLPDRHEGTATYEGLQDRHLESPIVLDWGPYKARRWMVVKGPHDTATALGEIKDVLKRWNDHGSLGVIVRDGDAVDAARQAEFDEWRRQEAAE